MLALVARAVLKVLPASAAFPLSTHLAGLPMRSPLKTRDRDALGRAQRMKWGASNRHCAWSWGQGPAVLLVHGWHGRATQMAPLAETIAAAGFRCLAPDFTGHGESPGMQIRFDTFVREIVDFSSRLGEPLHALVGHSAGALTMMTARQIGAVTARKYVCLNAPRHPYPPIASIRETLDPGQTVLDRCATFYAGQFPFDPVRLAQGEAYRYRRQGRLMLVYDRDDPRIDFSDADILASEWPGAEVIRTQGLGHQNSLWSGPVLSAVTQFVAED